MILKILHKLWWGTPFEEPPPTFPPANDVVGWMNAKAEWFEKHCPEHLSNLFDPTSGDYIPKAVHVAVSQEAFHTKYLEAYRELKKRYPSHINTKDPRENWVYYGGGDPQDYPND